VRDDDFFSLPNVISLARFVLAAAVLAVRGTTEQVAIIGIASATDFLDGWLARRRQTTTRLGALLDPVADRCFVVACVVSLLLQGALTTGQYLILLSRDIATAIGFIVARIIPWLRRVTFQARYLGKAVTVLQLATLVAALVVPAAVPWLIALVAVTSAAAIADYTMALWRGRARAT
jgi:CDP-diacylglycerol--glycerol-3-phosphate 3-phosphatidyltransferase